MSLSNLAYAKAMWSSQMIAPCMWERCGAAGDLHALDPGCGFATRYEKGWTRDAVDNGCRAFLYGPHASAGGAQPCV